MPRSFHPAREGRFMRRLEAERTEFVALEIRRSRTRWPTVSAGAAPAREVSHTSRPGGFGTRPGGITTALQGACWTGTACGGDIALRVPGSADPGPVRWNLFCLASRMWSAGRRARFASARRAITSADIEGAPAGAPRPSHFERAKTSHRNAGAPAPSKKSGRMARANFPSASGANETRRMGCITRSRALPNHLAHAFNRSRRNARKHY